jgi:hypothetical protein
MKSQAVEIGETLGHEYWIIPGPMSPRRGGLNGYAVYKKRPLIEPGYHGIVSYIPVHGGITYAEESEEGFVYGFDTAHCDSEEYPRNDHAWIIEQIETMIEGIHRAQIVEERYLNGSDEEKIKCGQFVVDALNDQKNLPWGAMINCLCGQP